MTVNTHVLFLLIFLCFFFFASHSVFSMTHECIMAYGLVVMSIMLRCMNVSKLVDVLILVESFWVETTEGRNPW